MIIIKHTKIFRSLYYHGFKICRYESAAVRSMQNTNGPATRVRAGALREIEKGLPLTICCEWIGGAFAAPRACK
jgi:hypothetical protein